MTELVQKYNGFVDKYNEINTNIASLEEEKFYTAHELTDKNKDLLSGLGFTLKGASDNKSTDVHVEIYESTLPDEVLREKVILFTEEFEKAQEKKFERIRLQFDTKQASDYEREM